MVCHQGPGSKNFRERAKTTRGLMDEAFTVSKDVKKPSRGKRINRTGGKT